jgi:hypothetical protein
MKWLFYSVGGAYEEDDAEADQIYDKLDLLLPLSIYLYIYLYIYLSMPVLSTQHVTCLHCYIWL